MLFIVFLLTVSYVVVVVRVLRSKRRRAVVVVRCLHEDDRPPASAVGWPPEGARFDEYVEDGFAALDAYRSSALPPEVG
jgi:hypothetical protein